MPKNPDGCQPSSYQNLSIDLVALLDFEFSVTVFEDSEKTAARSAAGFSPTLPPIFSATFVKISTQCHVRSGHQVRSSDPTTK